MLTQVSGGLEYENNIDVSHFGCHVDHTNSIRRANDSNCFSINSYDGAGCPGNIANSSIEGPIR